MKTSDQNKLNDNDSVKTSKISGNKREQAEPNPTKSNNTTKSDQN